jgi:hypothetical protein
MQNPNSFYPYPQQSNNAQILQDKVDKLKLLNLTSNIHNLTPPQSEDNDNSKEIALVTALSVSPRLVEIFFEVRGLEYSPQEKRYIQVTRPIMNFEGAYRFVKVLKNIAQETEWASFAEDEINSRIIHYFEENYPYFTFHAKMYDLDESDFNYVATTLQSFIDSCFHKSKSGKYINTLGRTYDEGVLRKALETGDNMVNRKDGGFLGKLNPFRDKSWQ